jgi:two-component system response regulator CpxR
MRILIIDDDIELCDLLTEYLTREGYVVLPCHDGRQGLASALADDCDFVIMDIMLPSYNAVDLLRQLRCLSTIPILMLTARGNAADRIVGLEIGADDYLDKPFDPGELVARIRAIQRHGENEFGTQPPTTGTLVADDLLIDIDSRTVSKDNSTVSLTAIECALLHALVKRIDQVVGREILAREALGRKLERFDRSIDVHISSLRRKLGRNANGLERIKTVRSVGYMFSST